MAKFIQRLFLIGGLSIYVTFLYCQDPSIYLNKAKELYPNEDEIILEERHLVKLDLVEGKPYVTESTAEERLVISERACKNDRESVYFSSFHDLAEINAQVGLPHKTRYKYQEIDEFYERDVLSESIFHDDTKAMDFRYPNLVPGAIKKHSYTHHFISEYLLPTIYLQADEPMEDFLLRIEVDPDISIGFAEHNLEGFEIEYEETQINGTMIYQWKGEFIEKAEFEDRAPGIKHYVPHINIFIKSYNGEGGTTDVLQDVDGLYSWYSSLVEKINHDSDSSDVDEILSELVLESDEDLIKAQKIFAWVQDNIKYIAFEDGYGGFIPRPAHKVCNRRYGDCKDMSNLMYYMMRESGLDAYLTWIGTRDIPYNYSDLASPATDNHMILTLKHKDDFYFLDATNPNGAFGMPTYAIQGKEALIGIDKESYEIQKVPVLTEKESFHQDSCDIEIDGTILTGKGKAEYGGYFNSWIRGALLDEKDSDLDDMVRLTLSKGNNSFDLDSYAIKGLKDRNEQTEIRYSYALQSGATVAGNKIYLNPHLERPFENDGLREDRKLPYSSAHYSSRNFTYRVLIPYGYEATYVPEDALYEHEKFGFEATYETTSESVTVRLTLHRRFLLLEAEDFGDWNEMIDLLSQTYRETLVMSKSRVD